MYLHIEIAPVKDISIDAKMPLDAAVKTQTGNEQKTLSVRAPPPSGVSSARR